MIEIEKHRYNRSVGTFERYDGANWYLMDGDELNDYLLSLQTQLEKTTLLLGEEILAKESLQAEMEQLREGLKYLSERLEETEHDNLVLYIRNLNNNRNE